MQHFYDGQIRRYITQTIRVFSNFVVKYGDGSLHKIPVMYGDPDRQVAAIIRGNSENVTNSVPRIAIYISALDVDKERLADSSYVGKVHIRERGVEGGSYNQTQGRNYTVERLMPTPYKLTMKVDIWSSNTDQKLQIMEQLLVLFNPSLELQTSDNFVDWTALTVLNLTSINWSSKSVPVGAETPIDIGTLTVDTPIWISPPAKVKHLGVITQIVNNFFSGGSVSDYGYAAGLGEDLASPGTATFNIGIGSHPVTVGGFGVQVYDGRAILLNSGESVSPPVGALEPSVALGSRLNWSVLFEQIAGPYVAGSSQIFLLQSDGTEVVGTFAIDALDESVISINWNTDTLSPNTGIDSNGMMDTDPGYTVPAYRNGTNNNGSPGNFDAIIDPQITGPNDPKFIARYGELSAGRRYLIIENIGDVANADGPDAWKSISNQDFYANANDIIEWDGSSWNVIFDSVQESDTMIWQTNIYTGVQYKWDGIAWVKSFEGEYKAGKWRIAL
jgi:hypothetical protein